MTNADGQPLILVPGGSGGVYGQADTEYVTEKRSGIRVKAIGQSGNGPASFEVKTGDGRTLLYGSTPFTIVNGVGSGSQVKDFVKGEIFSWKIDSITDWNGNKITYQYDIYVSNLYADSVYYSRLNKILYDGNLSGTNKTIELDFRWKESLTYNEWTTRVLSDDSIYSAFESEKESYGDFATDGFILANQDKLDIVRIKVSNYLFNEYKIAYQTVETFSQVPIHNVSSISECYGSNCAAIQFDWEQVHRGSATSAQCTKHSEFVGGEPAYSTSYIKSTPYTNNFGWGGGNYYSQLVGDYNNDGLMDVAVVYTFQNGSQSDMSAHIAYSDGNGQFSPAATSYSATLGGPILNHRLTGDFNNDGYMDLMATNSSSAGWNVYTILNNRDGTFAPPIYQQVSTAGFIDDKTYQHAVGDFNGDGNLDVIAFGIGHGDSKNDSIYSKVNGLVAYIALGDGNGNFSTANGGQLATPAQIANSYRANRSLFTGDFNGDGITDIGSSYFANGATKLFNAYKGSEMIVALGRADGTFEPPVINRRPHTEYPVAFETDSQRYREIQTADINGDGLTDIIALQGSYGGILPSNAFTTGNLVTANPDFSRRVIVSMISNGDGTFSRRIYEDIIDINHVNPGSGCESTSHGAIVADFNNDGFSDISFGGTDFYLGRGNGRFLKQGGRFISGDDVVKTGGGLTTLSFPIPDTTYVSYAFDVNRDGNPDAVEVVVDSNGLRIGTNAYAKNISQQYLNKITDGYGREIIIDYDSIMNNQVYTKGTGAVYPYRDIGTGSTVVSKVTMSDGLGGYYNLSYRYASLIADLARNESLGFATVSVTDSRDNINTTTRYAQLFPLTGLPVNQQVRLSDNTLINETTSNCDVV